MSVRKFVNSTTVARPGAGLAVADLAPVTSPSMGRSAARCSLLACRPRESRLSHPKTGRPTRSA